MSKKEVRQAAAVVRADDFIREMPQGYKTTVNERCGTDRAPL